MVINLCRGGLSSHWHTASQPRLLVPSHRLNTGQAANAVYRVWVSSKSNNERESSWLCWTGTCRHSAVYHDLNDLSLRIGLSGLSGEVMGDVFTLFKSWNSLGK